MDAPLALAPMPAELVAFIGGPEGCRVLAAGTPGDMARDAGSVTGPWLAEYLGLPGVSR